MTSPINPNTIKMQLNTIEIGNSTAMKVIETLISPGEFQYSGSYSPGEQHFQKGKIILGFVEYPEKVCNISTRIFGDMILPEGVRSIGSMLFEKDGFVTTYDEADAMRWFKGATKVSQ